MWELEHSLRQHGIEIADWLLPPSESAKEDPPSAGMPDAGCPPQEQASLPDLLPGELGMTLRQYAEGLEIPVEACYWVILCAASSLIPSRTRLVLDPCSGFEVPPILWGGLVGEAGGGEYRLVNTLIRPLKAVHGWLEVRYRSQLGKYKAAMRRLRRGAAIETPIERPERIRLYTNEWTIKAIGRILSQQPERGLLVDADWMMKFLLGTNIWQCGRGMDHYRWLRLYDGDALKIERGAAGPIFVRYPSISIVGGIRPYGLREFWKKCVRKGSNLWSCFAWAEVPFMHDPDDDTRPYPHPRELLTITYYRLLKSPPVQHRLDEDGLQLWEEWERDFDDPILSQPFDLLRAILIRTKERAARIALVLHWLQAACSKVPPSEVIPANTLGKGMELALWLQRQSKAIFSDSSLDGVFAVAKRVAWPRG
jgi:hypothetical protein